MEVDADRRLLANGITVDLAAEALIGDDGTSIELRPQTFAVLRYLTKNAHRLVSKEELMRAVWPGIAVTDDSLVQCIHEIRRALGDLQHTVLQTVPRRGYRLALDDAAAPGATAAVVGARPGIRIATIGVAVVAVLAGMAVWWLYADPGRPVSLTDTLPSIAVLPFENFGGDPEQEYFADGITDDLITDLSKLSGLLVIARNSVWPYKGNPVDARNVAEDLGVRYVLEGSVRRDGDQVRINAQLIDAAGQHHLWAERYDGTLGDVFALQDRVISNIISALAVKLTAREIAEAATVETEDMQAFDALLRGLDYLRRGTEPETVEAIKLFEQATTLDPHYSRAYAALAAANWLIVRTYWFVAAGSNWQHAWENLQSNLAKASEKPTGLAHAVEAEVLAQQGRYEEAFGAADRAIALSPGDPMPHVSRAAILNASGRAREAEEEIRIANRFDPLFAPATLRLLSESLFHQERYEEAVDVIDRIVAQGAATTDDYSTRVSALGHLGRSNEYQAAIDGYNNLAVGTAYDPLTVQESQWFWNGDVFDYHRPYIERLLEGLRKAHVPEGAGTDIPLDAYKRLITRRGGEFETAGAAEVDAATARALAERGVPMIDVRASPDFNLGHIPGAKNLSLVFDLSKENLMQVAGPDDEVIFYCHGKYCPYSAYASAKAIVWGWRRVYRFAGGFPAWEDAGYSVEVTTK